MNASLAEDGADFDSTEFFGDMNLSSGTIKTATLGAGDDDVAISGQAGASDSSYDLGEGDNTINFNGVDLGGSVTAGDGDNTVNVNANSPAPSVLETGSITLGDGDNTIDVDGSVHGDITLGDGTNSVLVGSNLEGTLTTGDGVNSVDVGSAIVGATLSFGAGGNAVAVALDVSVSDLTFGDGNNTVEVGSDITGSTLSFGEGDNKVTSASDIRGGSALTFGDGNNTVSADGDDISASTITFGDGDNEVYAYDDIGGGSSITFGSGRNTVTVDNDIDLATLTFGDGDNIVNVYDDIENGAVLNFGDGNNTVTVEYDDINGSMLTFGNGDNTINVGNDIDSSNITFGDGSNTVIVDDEIEKGAVLVFGDGDNTVVVKDEIELASLTFGDGDNSLEVYENIRSGADITFGSGADSLTLGEVGVDGSHVESISVRGIGTATSVDMGDGDDQVTMLGGYSDDDLTIVRSGGFVRGGEGSDTLSLLADGDSVLIERASVQEVTVDYSEEEFTLGQVITVTFERGEDTFEVEYTVVEDDFVQGPEGLAAKVAQSVAAKLNSDDDFAGLFDAIANNGVLEIESDQPLEDFVLSSSVGEVEVVTLSDARITSFETLELVALNSAGEDAITINADFELIEGTTSVNLISQVELNETVQDADLNGAFTQNGSNGSDGATTFELVALNGGEAITVSGYETSATGNSQVSRIFVGINDGDHVVGDTISVTINDVTVDYVIKASDLTADTGLMDANQIATSLATAISSAAANAGLTVSVDAGVAANGPAQPFVTLIGQPGVDFDLEVAHTRFEAEEIEIRQDTTFNVTDAMSSLQVGDVITITVGDDEASYTVTEEDCNRLEADAIVAHFKDALDLGGDWGELTSQDLATLTLTRVIDLVEEDRDGDKTFHMIVQDATDTDDGISDVVINATLAADATDTTMDLTVAGQGNFDILIGDNSGYEDLSLKLGDAFSHTVDTFGDGGNFANSITVTDVVGVNTVGQQIDLEYVLAHTVDTTGSAANFSIEQLIVRQNAVADFAGETITVTTGDGDDHLITLAQSAMAEGSSIDLGIGRNTLSLGWGNVDIDHQDLADIADISLTGNLTRLDILNDVLLGEDTETTLALPGDGAGVEVLTLTDVRVASDGVAALTVEGAATNLHIVSAEDFGKDSNDQVVFEAVGVENLSFEIGDEINVELNGAELRTVDIRADDDAELLMDGSAAQNAGYASLTLIDVQAEDNVDVSLSNLVSGAELVVVGDEDQNDNGYADVRLSNVTLGDVSVSAGYDATLTVSDTSFDEVADERGSVTLGNVSIASSVSDAEFLIAGNSDADILIDGSVDIYAEKFAAIVIGYQAGTNVDMATGDGQSISLISCASDAVVGIGLNFNNHDPFGPDPVNDGFIQDFTIALGDVNLDAGQDAQLVIVSNSDDTYFGNLTVQVGDVDMFAYGDAEISVSDNDAATVGIGNVTMSAQYDASISVSDNDGRVYDNPNNGTEEYDFAIVNFGNVVMSASDASIVIEDNNLAQISMGNVEMTAGSDATFIIEDNNVFGEDLDTRIETTEVDISIGNVTMTAGSDAEFSIDDNDALASDSEIRIDVGNVVLTTVAGGLDVDFNIEDQNAGNAATINITVGNVTLDSASDADFNISDNDASDGSVINITVGNVSITAVDQADFEIDRNDATDGATVNIEVGTVMLVSTAERAEFEIDRNDASDGSVLNITVGDVDMTADTSLEFNIDNNNASDGSTITINVAMGDDESVRLDAAGSDAEFSIYYNGAASYISDDTTIVINVSDVTITAGSDAEFTIDDNYADTNGSATVTINVGDVTIGTADDAIGGNALFDITGNTAVVFVGSDADATVNITVGAVSMNAVSDVDFYIEDNNAFDSNSFGGEDSEATVNITVGAIDIVSGSDVDFYIDDNIAFGEDADVFVTTGIIDIDAGNDVDFFVDGSDSTETTLGETVTITAGLDIVGSNNVSSLVDVYMNDVSGADVVTITANSNGTGSGDIFGIFDDTVDMHTLNVSGTNAELYFFDTMGSDDDGNFTLDLTGLTGSFGNAYNPDGVFGQASDIDEGTFVVNVGAVFAGAVFVQIGSGDLIYNAQNSAFTGNGADFYVDTSDSDHVLNDWFGADGWFSLGTNLDLEPTSLVRTFTVPSHGDLGLGNNDSGTWSFNLVVDGVAHNMSFTATDPNSGGNFYSWSNPFDINGGSSVGGISVSGSGNTLTVTGSVDGTSFTASPTTAAKTNGDGVAAVDFNVQTPTGGNTPDDGLGNSASEVFQFSGGDIGNVAIGGFNANAIRSSDDGIDYLDFSAFDGVSRLADLNFFTDVTEIDLGGDGYFNDVIITSSAFDGSVRLVGLAEYDGWQAALNSSIIFNQSELV